MAISVEWANEERSIILQDFGESWTWDEFYEQNGFRIPNMIREVPHTVHIFSDFSGSSVPPVGGVLTNSRNVISLYPDNWGLLVIVGGNGFINVLASMFSKVFSTSVGAKTNNSH